MQFVQKIFYVHFKLTASDSFKFFFQAVRNCRRRVPLLQHLPNPCSYGIHAETEALVNIQQHRSILVNCLAYTFGQGDRTFRFSVLHRNVLHKHWLGSSMSWADVEKSRDLSRNYALDQPLTTALLGANAGSQCSRFDRFWIRDTRSFKCLNRFEDRRSGLSH